MKKFSVFLIAVLFITTAGCQTKPSPQANQTASPTVQISTPKPKQNPCGDGVCDAAEQASPNLCPADCAGAIAPPTKANANAIPPTSTPKKANLDASTATPSIASINTAAPSPPPKKDEPATATPSATSTSAPSPTPTTETLPDELTFIPDPGIRIKMATQPAPVIGDDGAIYIFYSNKMVLPNDPSSNVVARSEDGLTFTETGLDPNRVSAVNPFATQLPDGTWRIYDLDAQRGVVTSRSSTDGIHFTPDDGVRYTTPTEHLPVGVRDFFVNTAGDVIYLYIGAMAKPEHHIRQAISTDGGNTFTLYNDNVLGDQDKPDLERHVDPKFVTLPDGSARLITMVQEQVAIPGQRACCKIYSFTSADGYTFTQDPGIRLQTSDFTEFTVWSLNDPWVIMLPDGRFRLYIAALVSDGSSDKPFWAIVSATTP